MVAVDQDWLKSLAEEFNVVAVSAGVDGSEETGEEGGGGEDEEEEEEGGEEGGDVGTGGLGGACLRINRWMDGWMDGWMDRWLGSSLVRR